MQIDAEKLHDALHAKASEFDSDKEAKKRIQEVLEEVFDICPSLAIGIALSSPHSCLLMGIAVGIAMAEAHQLQEMAGEVRR